MWQAISHLLSEQLGEGEIELRNELPGGEIHAAWHLRYAGRDFFVKCDERELFRLYGRSRSAGATFPQSNGIGTASLGSRRDEITAFW
jgi:fructosamine-3-kinase